MGLFFKISIGLIATVWLFTSLYYDTYSLYNKYRKETLSVLQYEQRVKQCTDRNYVAMVERSTEGYVREVLCNNQGLLLKVK